MLCLYIYIYIYTRGRCAWEGGRCTWAKKIPTPIIIQHPNVTRNPPSPVVIQYIFVILKRTHWPAIWNRRVPRGKPNVMLQRSTIGPLCKHWMWCCNVNNFARQVELRMMQTCMRNILTRLNFDNLYSNSAHLTDSICGGGRELERPV